jgi:hypothetical protein
MMMHADSHHAHRPRHASRAEYAVYFALILVISVPTAMVRSVMPNRTGLPRRFFLAEAWAMAHRVTPQIFAV